VKEPLSHAELWGGPEDGELVWVPAVLPYLIGVVRTDDGALVPVRDLRQLQIEREHVAVYVHDPEREQGRVRPVYRYRSRPPSQVDA
jgi:hypothetical protein